MTSPSSTLDCPPRGEPKLLGDDAAMSTQAGFTLIELMVVLLIIAILLAIAIPTFLGVTNTAGDRAAQSNVTNALTEAKALYQINQAYSTGGVAYTAGQFASQAPEFAWTTAACATSASNCVSVTPFSSAAAGDGQGVVIAVASSKTNTCWFGFDFETAPSSLALKPGASVPSAGVFYAKEPVPTTGCSSLAVDPDNDTYVRFGAAGTSTSGQNYATAPTIS
jgi:type IV pilus assembly protein PilA